jgi:transporter family protein
MEVIIFIMLANIFWGTHDFLIKIGVKTLHPIKVALLSSTIMLLIMLGLSIANGEIGVLFSLDASTILLLAVGGAVNIFIGRCFSYTAIKSIGASRASPLTANRAVFGVILASIFLRETITIGLGVGTISIVLGIYLISKSDPMQRIAERYDFLRGILIALGAAFSWGFASIILKLGLQNSPPILGNFIAASAAVLSYIIFLTFTRNRNLREVDRYSLIYIIGSGVSGTIATLSYFSALFIAPAGIVTSSTNAYPLVAILLGWIFLRKMEMINFRAIIGAVLVLIGTYLATAAL